MHAGIHQEKLFSRDATEPKSISTLTFKKNLSEVRGAASGYYAGIKLYLFRSPPLSLPPHTYRTHTTHLFSTTQSSIGLCLDVPVLRGYRSRRFHVHSPATVRARVSATVLK
jgi:hypothetical protein